MITDSNMNLKVSVQQGEHIVTAHAVYAVPQTQGS